MPREEFPVDLNRDEPGAITPRADRIEAVGPFGVEFVNHGSPAHVHLRLDDTLSSVASVEPANHYVEEESELVVEIDVAALEDPVEGALTISTRFGAESVRLPVTVRTGDRPVEVDERLAEPPPAEESGEPKGDRALATDIGIAPGTLAVGVLAVLAVGLALGIAVFVGTLAALLGVLAVLGAVAIALAMLWWE